MNTRALVSLTCGLVALLCWALASPIGASPDDDFHLPSIWCGRGNVANQCQVPADGSNVLLPGPFGQGMYCYAFRNTVSAACQKSIKDWKDTTLTTPSRSNIISKLYPPGYYHVMSFFVSDNIKRSALRMRAFNCILAVCLLAILLRFARGSPIQFSVTWTLLVASIPLGLFCVASNNPSSWSIIGVGTFWAFLFLLQRTEATTPSDTKRALLLGGLALFSAFLAVSSRVDGAVYICISTLCALLASVSRPLELIHLRHRSLTLTVSCVAILGSCLAFVFLGQGTSVATKGLADTAPASRTLAQLLFENIRSFPDLWGGAVGGWGLGWLDTAMPRSVMLIVFGIAFYLIIAGMQFAPRGKVLAFCVCLAVLAVLPILVLTQSGHIVGETVQPRYLLPLIYLLIGLSLVGRPTEKTRCLSRTTAFVFALLLSVAHSLALHQNIRRYTVGLQSIGFDLNYRVEWWWQHAPSPMATWILGSVAFLVVCLLMTLRADTLSHEEESAR